MSIIIEMPVPYRARVIRRGCRSESVESFVATVPVRVNEHPSERAPVALRAVLPDGRIMVYREVNGSLARPLLVRLGGREVAVTDGNVAEVLESFRQNILRIPGSWPFLPEFYETHGWVMRDGADVRRMISNDREERIQAYREAFEFGSAFVDGVLFVPSLGPAWVVRSSPDMHAELRPELGHERGPRTPKDWVLPWDSLPEAEAKVREAVATGRWHGPAAPSIGDTRGTVITRAALEAGTETLHIEVAAAAEAMIALSSPVLHRMTPEGIHAFADLKAGVDSGVTAESAEGVLMALRDLHDRWTEFHGGKPPVPGADPVAELLSSIEAERNHALDGADHRTLASLI